jgi:HTH-type transcriptional regulator / antitoxin HipB
MSAIVNVSQLGELVKARRKALGLTQIELAQRARCGHRLIRELEHGKESIQMGRALEICHLLNIKLLATMPDKTTVKADKLGEISFL